MTNPEDQVNENVASDPVLDAAFRERNWLIWALTPRTRPNGVTTLAKLPVREGPLGLETVDRELAATLTYAEAKAKAPKNGGVGYFPREGSALIGYDIDKCFDENGAPDARAKVLMDTPGYLEKSPSGTGLRALIARPETEPDAGFQSNENRGAGMFETGTGKYFTFRHDPLPGHEKVLARVEMRNRVRDMYDAHKATSVAAGDMPKDITPTTDRVRLDSLRRNVNPDLMEAIRAHGTPDRSGALFQAGIVARRCGINAEDFAGLVLHEPGHSDALAHALDQPSALRAVLKAWAAGEGLLARKQFGTPEGEVPSARAPSARSGDDDPFAGLTPGPSDDPFQPYVEPPVAPPPALMPIGDLRGFVAKNRYVVEQLLPKAPFGVVGPGGGMKSTLMLRMAIEVVLGRDLWGFRVLEKGRVVFVSKEDDLDVFKDRLHRMVEDMGLSEAQKDAVFAGVFVRDLSGTMRKLVRMERNGTAILEELADEVASQVLALGGVSVTIFDPLSHFIPAEGNEAMAAVMTAGHLVSKATGCATGFVHHVSQSAAREKMTDQHAGRGGTAFADNSRGQWVVHWLSEWDPSSVPAPITERDVDERRVAEVTVPKVSYAAPILDRLFILRDATSPFHLHLIKGGPIAVGAAKVSGVNKAARDAKMDADKLDVLAEITAHGPLPIGDILLPDMTDKRVRAAIKGLLRDGIIEGHEQAPLKGTGGRPSVHYAVK